MLKGNFKGIEFEYNPHDKEHESNGILIVKHRNGVESSHIINNWHYTRIMQYVISMDKTV